MVAISAVRSSNESLRDLPSHLSSPTAVFTGATQGIGLATLRQLATYTVAPTCYIVGRSESRVQEIINELKELNVKGTYIFVKGEVALLESVDECCAKVKESLGEKGLDLLYMSQGYLSFGGRDGTLLCDVIKTVKSLRTCRLTVSPAETKEGIDTLLSLRYYSRLRFVHNLLVSVNISFTLLCLPNIRLKQHTSLPSASCTPFPLLPPSYQHTHPLTSSHPPQPLLSLAPNPRTVSVLAGGQEGKINLDDLSLKHNYGVLTCANHGSTMTSLAFEHLAHQHPTISFIHVFPGYVRTNIMQSGFPWVCLPFTSLPEYERSETTCADGGNIYSPSPTSSNTSSSL
ncbi:MAG: hypothetical protein Q9184_008258 [Pyrenodesmia sp. 2 TL-2023]